MSTWSFKSEETLTKADDMKNAGRRRHINHPGPTSEVMSFRAENSGSTGGFHAHVHLNDSRNDKYTEVHHGAPGQHSQGGDTVLGDLA